MNSYQDGRLINVICYYYHFKFLRCLAGRDEEASVTSVLKNVYVSFCIYLYRFWHSWTEAFVTIIIKNKYQNYIATPFFPVVFKTQRRSVWWEDICSIYVEIYNNNNNSNRFFKAPYLVRARSAYKYIRIRSFQHTHAPPPLSLSLSLSLLIMVYFLRNGRWQSCILYIRKGI